jgi:hypothetical protein
MQSSTLATVFTLDFWCKEECPQNERGPVTILFTDQAESKHNFEAGHNDRYDDEDDDDPGDAYRLAGTR